MTNSFKDFNLKPFLIQALEDINFREPKEIQTKVIPEVNSGRDLVGQSQTGSGKTHAFLLPLLNQIDPELNEVQVVITSPSRELSEQLNKVAAQLVSFSDSLIRIGHYIGGTDKEKQLEKLKNNQPQIVIGTPGRILDLIKEDALKIHTASHMVIDEADMTLDMGFLNEVDQIASKLSKDMQMLVFSATIPNKLRPFLKKYMDNPNFIEIENEELISENVENWLVPTKSRNRVEMIYEILTIGQPYLALIFANTKQNVDDIAAALEQKEMNVGVIHGGLTPRDRKKVMRQIHNLEFQFVVATDLASRGIDIEGVSHVINAEIPNELDFFVHRVGRTGRNNLDGLAITLYEPDETEAIEYLEKQGIEFTPKELKNGELVDSYNKNRRQIRKNQNKEVYDPEIAGMAKKAKKNIKPGYKKKIERYKKRKNKRNSKRNK